MWFKTRVGLCLLPEAFDIRAWKSPKTGDWAIVAMGRRTGAADIRVAFFFRAKTTPAWYYLACFRDADTVQAEIGRTFAAIADAVRSGAPLCDLSTAGVAEAWDPTVRHIEWP